MMIFFAMATTYAFVGEKEKSFFESAVSPSLDRLL